MKGLLLHAGLINGLLVFLTATSSLADAVPYRGRLSISTIDTGLHALHEHDWSSPKLHKLSADRRDGEWVFSAANDFSFVELGRVGSEILFRQPSPALTKLYISGEHELLIGLSTVMLDNPFQLVVWDKNGAVIHREHISNLVAKLGPGGDGKLYKKFPSTRETLAKHMFLYGGTLYCDFNFPGLSERIGAEAWSYLFDRRVWHPYSDDFLESVTNSIIWYDEKDPDVKVITKGSSYLLSVRSPKGRVMKIPIGPKNAEK
jgi:hypothetical protein